MNFFTEPKNAFAWSSCQVLHELCKMNTGENISLKILSFPVALSSHCFLFCTQENPQAFDLNVANIILKKSRVSIQLYGKKKCTVLFSKVVTYGFDTYKHISFLNISKIQIFHEVLIYS